MFKNNRDFVRGYFVSGGGKSLISSFVELICGGSCLSVIVTWLCFMVTVCLLAGVFLWVGEEYSLDP